MFAVLYSINKDYKPVNESFLILKFHNLNLEVYFSKINSLIELQLVSGSFRRSLLRWKINKHLLRILLWHKNDFFENGLMEMRQNFYRTVTCRYGLKPSIRIFHNFEALNSIFLKNSISIKLKSLLWTSNSSEFSNSVKANWIFYLKYAKIWKLIKEIPIDPKLLIETIFLCYMN